MKVLINNRLVEKRHAKISVFDSGFLYGDGFYQYMPVYHGQIFVFTEHWKHIQDNCRVLGYTFPWSLATTKQHLRRLIRQARLPYGHIRFMITRGQHGFSFTNTAHPTIIATYAHSQAPQLRHNHGYTARTMIGERFLPTIKTLATTAMIAGYRTFPMVDEVILVDKNGYVREGVESNIVIVRNGRLYTPNDQVYPGIVVDLVAKLAQRLGYRLQRQEFTLNRCYTADEVFMTNFDGGVRPVITLDQRQIGQGNIGTVTKQLMTAYADYVEQHCPSQPGRKA